MPVVPTYGQTKVAPDAIPGARITAQVSPQALGSDIAKGVGDIASLQKDAFLREKQRQDQIATQDADNQDAQKFQDLLYNPKTGALNTRGKQAFGIHDTVLADYDENVGKIEAGLSNNTQRDAFRQAAAQRKLQLTGALDRHLATEARAYDDESTQGKIQTTLAGITQKPDDWRSIEIDIGNLKRAIAEHGERNGLPADKVTASTSEAVTRARVSVIDNLLASGKTADAKTYFTTVGEDITGPVRADITAKLELGDKRDQSRGISDEITLKAPDLKTALEALEKRGIADTKVYDDAKGRLVSHFNLQAAADNAYQNNLVEEAHGILNDPNNQDGILDPRMTAKLGSMKSSVRESFESYAAKKASGVPIQTNRFTKEKLYRLATNPASRDQFMDPLKTNLRRDYADQLSDADYEMFSKMQADMAADKTKGSSKTYDGILTTEQVIGAVLRQNDIDTSAKDDATLKRIDSFRDQLNTHAVAFEQKNQRNITPDELRPIANRLLATATWSEPRAGYNPVGWVLGDHERSSKSFEVPNADRIATDIDQVPPDHLERIKKSLVGNRGVATPDAIVRSYNAWVARQPKAPNE
jgi:hypothetical protein